MAAGGYIVENQPAIAVDGINDLFYRAQAGDDDGHFMLDANCQICLQPWVAVVHNQVNGVGRRIVQCRQPGFDLFKPGFETNAVTLIERRKAAHDTIAATRQDELRVGNQEHGRGNYRQAQALIQQGRQ